MSKLTNNFESDWSRKLKGSQSKSREWLFRHALELFEFQLECKKQANNLPSSVKIYYGAKVNEWLGYSADLASKWSRAGSFLHRVNEGIEVPASFKANGLPASMSTLLEFARMSTDELEAIADRVSPQITVADVIEFRYEYRHRSEPEEEPQVDEEPSPLHFTYAGNIPVWLIDKIEELADALGKDEMGNTVKTEQDGFTYVCSRKNDHWTMHREAPKQDEPKRKKQTYDGRYEKTAPPLGSVSVSKEMADALYILGINLRGGYVEKWSLAGLMKSAKHVYHPDKTGGSDETFKKLPGIEEQLKRG